MNTPKPQQAQHTPRSQDPLEIAPPDRRPGQRPEDFEVIDLAVDEDIDVGGDPYNSTGQHVIIELRKNKYDDQ